MNTEKTDPRDLIPTSSVPYSQASMTPSTYEIAARCHAAGHAGQRLIELAEMCHQESNHLAVAKALSAFEQAVEIPANFHGIPDLDILFYLEDDEPEEEEDGDAWYVNAGTGLQKAEARLKEAATRYVKDLEKADAEPVGPQARAEIYLTAATVQANAAALYYHVGQVESETASHHQKSGNRTASLGIALTLEACMNELQRMSRQGGAGRNAKRRLVTQSLDRGNRALEKFRMCQQNTGCLLPMEMSQELKRDNGEAGQRAKELAATLSGGDQPFICDLSPQMLDLCGGLVAYEYQSKLRVEKVRELYPEHTPVETVMQHLSRMEHQVEEITANPQSYEAAHPGRDAGQDATDLLETMCFMGSLAMEYLHTEDTEEAGYALNGIWKLTGDRRSVETAAMLLSNANKDTANALMQHYLEEPKLPGEDAAKAVLNAATEAGIAEPVLREIVRAMGREPEGMGVPAQEVPWSEAETILE